jgi:predicted permease
MIDFHDLKHAVRTLAKSPAQTAVIVLTLAAGIGVNAVLFGFVEGIWTRPLPGTRDSAALVHVYGQDEGATRQARGPLSYPEILELRKSAPAFSALAGVERRGPCLHGNGFLDTLLTEVVTDNYFTVLGVRPERGRLFSEGDAGSTGEPALVMSHSYWQRRFGGDPAVVGRSVRLGSTQFTVMGVAAPAFRGSELWLDADAWIPRSSWEAVGPGETGRREGQSHAVLGRLAPGADLAQAQAQADVVARGLAAAFPATNASRGFLVLGDRERRLTASGHAPMIAMLLASLVLLVACVNAGGLLYARHEARRHEAAIRLALGCSRRRLVAHLLGEGIVVSVLAAAAGLALSAVGLRILPLLLQPPGARFQNVFAVDGRMVAFAVGLACFSIALSGLIPAFRASRGDVESALREATSLGRSRRLGKGFMAGAQTAVATLLVALTVLFARSLIAVSDADLGFERRPVLLMQLAVPYPHARAAVFYDDLLARLRSLPEVRRAAITLRAPLSGSGGGRDEEVALPEDRRSSDERASRVKLGVVGTGYFDLLGVRFLGGRPFGSADTAASQPVVIVNRTMARQLWADGQALGRVLRIGTAPNAQSRRVIGVVADTRINSVTEDREPYMYLPAAQRGGSAMTLMVETRHDPMAWAGAARSEIAALDPNVIVRETTSLGNLVRGQTQAQRSQVTIVGLLGAVGLLLAASGLYALIGFLVLRRRREMAIRLAMGARSRQVLVLIVRHGLLVAGIALAVGLGGTLVVAPAVAGALYGVTPYDGTTYLIVAAVVLGVAGLASALPARRATRLDPAEVLRWE